MRTGLGTTGILPAGVKALLIANGAVYILQTFVGHRLTLLLGLNPSVFWGNGALWQPFTYLFLHGGFSHLLFNMLMLWMFGSALEQMWGMKQFLRYYFLTGVGAGLSNCILTPGMDIPIIGASGAVYGILAAYGLLFPNARIYIYLLFPIKAKYLVLIFGGLEFISSFRPDNGIAHIVHLGGMVVGIIYLQKDRMLKGLAQYLKGKVKAQEIKRQQQKASEEEELREEVDQLLDKINEIGLENLSSREKKRLQDASERLRDIERKNKIRHI